MNITINTRSFTATIYVELDGAVLSREQHQITVAREGDSYSARVDGEDVQVEVAIQLAERARRTGSLVQDTETIGKRVACVLHQDLGRLGHRNHYAVASAALNRPVQSLAALTAYEADLTWAYACGQLSIPTAPRSAA